MPVVKLNLAEAESNKPIEPGTYEFSVDSFEGPKKGQNSHYLRAICICQDEDQQGKRIWHTLPIDGKGAAITARFLSILTGEEIDAADMAEYEFDPDDLIGSTFLGTVRLRTADDGNEYPEFAKVDAL